MKKKLMLWIAGLSFAIVNSVFSQTSLVQEKTKFIYNFTREIEWPAENKSGAFVILVYGSTDLYNELKAYTASKMVVTQPIFLKKADKIVDIDQCNVLFISGEKINDILQIKLKIGNSRTLIITDKKEGVLEGAGISFVEMGSRLYYEINTENISKTGLKYSSDLVDLAVDIPISKR